ncbi:UV radiation resistance-associated gene protein isoform X2 [Aethina tumida]|nr:UV radiation resistance-associated gene protein isoform X2 [Aethina tumida]
MNFPSTELLLGRQRSRQWVPLLSQQLRLRHITHILAFNITSKKSDSFYFTFHLTPMCAPFYTSEKTKGPNLKWTELNVKNTINTSASALVLRIWQSRDNEMDKIVLTWGINLSGLVYLGNRAVEILPSYFKNNSVIFCIAGGYFSSQRTIRTDLPKPVPFIDNVNVCGDVGTGKVYRKTSVKTQSNEVCKSYSLEKLRRLQALQIAIRNKAVDVEHIKDKINVQKGEGNVKEGVQFAETSSSRANNVRYEPQLLTMNSLNKMLQERPTTLQKQEMIRLKKEIERTRYRTKLLSTERDRKLVLIRQLRQKHAARVEENDIKNSELMENYHALSREAEKLKEIKRNLLHHREIFRHLSSHVQFRRNQLMRQLLCIYPIEKKAENKYVIHNIYLPNSDVLTDCSDVGLSVALGYVTHILTMCSIILQVPLRYPMLHYGSRSYITDNVSPLLPDKEREFPLFARGKDKMQFTYAVYLLNKNIAQLRWLYYIHTPDLKATLPNLLGLLHGPRDRVELTTPFSGAGLLDTLSCAGLEDDPKRHSPSTSGLPCQQLVSLRSFGSSPNICDPILDCLKHERLQQRSASPVSHRTRTGQCSKELAIPEAFLNRQISKDSFKNMALDGCSNLLCCGESSTASRSSSTSSTINLNKIGIANIESCDICVNHDTNTDTIEEGTDPLDPSSNMSTLVSTTVRVHSTDQLPKDESKQNRRLSRSLGSYTEEDTILQLRTSFELGSEPLLNVSNDSKDEVKSLQGQQQFLEKWLETGPNLVCSEESLYPDEILGSTSLNFSTQPLTARTDALMNTKSFNLVRPKQ